MSKNVYEFDKQHTIGKNGEILLTVLFPNNFKMNTDFDGDLIINNKHKFELKTDTYKSGNFFFERKSNVRLDNDGSVWQSKHHECKYFAFYMIRYDVVCVWETDILLEWLENNISNYGEIIVENKTKESMGYAIPFNDVKHLCKDIINLKKINNYFKTKKELNLNIK